MIRYLVGFTLALVTSLGPTDLLGASPEDRIVRIGFVDPASISPGFPINVFWARLRELGWVEGRNLIIEARAAEGDYSRLPAIMREIVDRKLDVLVTYSTAAGIAAKNATSTVPIVNGAMLDPVRDGLVASLARPGGNLTGLSFGLSEGLGGKLLELLQETLPRLSTVALVTNPDNPAERALTKEVVSAAGARRLKLKVIPFHYPDSLQAVLQQARDQGQALLIFGDAILYQRRREIISFASQHGFPALYGLRDFATDGGLMAYGPNVVVVWRRAAEYVDKILRGTAPSELPVEQTAQFVLTVNTKAAKALGVTIPKSILLRADEVIR